MLNKLIHTALVLWLLGCFILFVAIDYLLLVQMVHSLD